MKKIFLYAILGVVALLAFEGCKEDVPQIQPSRISNIEATSLPGQIRLSWTREEPVTYHYVKVTYFDRLEKKDMIRLASSYTDTILIPNTRAKFGEYEFTLQPFSSTDTPGDIHKISAVSGPAIATYVLTDGPVTEIPLTVDMLSTNAQEPHEGPIANCLDRDPNTFFHTVWSRTLNELHYFQVNLSKAERAISFAYQGRHNNNVGDIKRVRIEGSNDGETWHDAKVHSFDPLPSGNGNILTSGRILFDNEYKKFRFTPLARRNADPINNSWFYFAEFFLYSAPYTIIDPEAPAEGD